MAAARNSFGFIRRFVAPLLLLMISVHAVTPLGEPAQRVAGSAFSAETEEVSLRSGQRGDVIKQAEVPQPPALRPAPLLATRGDLSARLAAQAPGLGPTGPPSLARSSFSPLSPRAPPAA